MKTWLLWCWLSWQREENEEMKHTKKYATKEDLEKLICLIRRGWQHGERVMVFSVGEGIKKDQATVDAKKVCHQLALDYGLPEIEGYYGITKAGEFVSV